MFRRRLVLRRDLAAQQPGRHGRRQRARQDEGGDHREDDRLGQRQEQVAGNAAELKQRQPDDADAQRGYEGRHDDLVGRVDDRGLQPLWLPPASASSRWVLMFSIITVASSTRMPTASARPPSVMTLMVWPSQDSTRIEVRMESGMEVATIRVERQLPTNSRTAMPARTRRGHHLLHHVLDRGAHEAGGVVERRDRDAGRQRLEQLRQLGPHAADDGQRRGVAGLQDLEQDRLLALHQHDVLLRRTAAMDVGHVAQIDDGVADLLDRQVVEGVDRERRRIGLRP